MLSNPRAAAAAALASPQASISAPSAAAALAPPLAELLILAVSSPDPWVASSPEAVMLSSPAAAPASSRPGQMIVTGVASALLKVSASVHSCTRAPE